jgi:hypothetical protein
MEAVQKDYFNITYIEHPTESVQLTAVQQNLDAIYYIKNPSPFVRTLKHVMNDEHLPRHQLLTFVEEALEKSKEYPFLLNILKEKGWA